MYVWILWFSTIIHTHLQVSVAYLLSGEINVLGICTSNMSRHYLTDYHSGHVNCLS